jgi:AcrR family transcriptional regulator
MADALTATAPPNGALTVKERILDASISLFAERGYDAASVQEIVDRAGVTKGALYHHFRAKDDLLYEIYRGLIDRQQAGLDRIAMAGAPAGETLLNLIIDLVESTAASRPAAIVFGREMHKLAAESMAAVRAARRRYHEGFRAVIERGVAEGAFAATASAETVTLIVFGIVNQLPQWFRPDGPTSPRALAEEIGGFVLAGLAPST